MTNQQLFIEMSFRVYVYVHLLERRERERRNWSYQVDWQEELRRLKIFTNPSAPHQKLLYHFENLFISLIISDILTECLGPCALLSVVVLPSSVYGSLSKAQNSCSSPSHCIAIPARGRNKSKKDAPTPLMALLFICQWPEHKNTTLLPWRVRKRLFILGCHISVLLSEI